MVQQPVGGDEYGKTTDRKTTDRTEIDREFDRLVGRDRLVGTYRRSGTSSGSNAESSD